MSEEYRIEKGIPMPASGTSGSKTHTLRRMDVGDSVFDANPKSNWRQHAALIGMKVKQRQEGSGIRVWRTA